MKKPINLRQETWDFMFESLRKMTSPQLKNVLIELDVQLPFYSTRNKAIVLIAEDPASFLFSIGILDRPELLERTVIELDDEVEYLINRKAANDIWDEKDIIELERLYDHKKFNVKRENIVKSLKNNRTFDQLDLKTD